MKVKFVKNTTDEIKITKNCFYIITNSYENSNIALIKDSKKHTQLSWKNCSTDLSSDGLFKNTYDLYSLLTTSLQNPNCYVL